ncbi:hypothetical protein PHLGIDRAFT_490904 [Phlebiopsis gigantea 11061_1 CR5-6]|uniref:Uncharacterized protein n=1 Tax=Phlebiopsis gigantea (strain 11061_1 CR5-6) TaxID=745531 RepID=A0A0C3S4Z6_PHLG1|nr:hypothetical protein PHLGIDRAFT_490904 [Phlebiopsis gigantea 11061_1 CR5-6]
MDRFPLELLQMIAVEACVDGGPTGCALSIVSRHVRNATAPARYRTVALVGQASIASFAQLIEKRAALIQVHHLLVTVESLPDNDANSKDSKADDQDSADGADDGPVDELDEDIIEASVMTILRAAASSLKTLFLHIDEHVFDMPQALALRYPLLEDLSVTQFNPNCIADDSGSPGFPQLKRLYSAYASRGYSRHNTLWHRLSVHTPRLETLRLSGFSYTIQVPEFLRVLLDVPPPAPGMIGNQRLAPVAGENAQYRPGSREAASAATAAARLPLLRTIILHHGVYVQKGWCGTGRFAHSGMRVALWKVADQVKQGEVNGEVHYLHPGPPRDSIAELRGDFLDVVSGRDDYETPAVCDLVPAGAHDRICPVAECKSSAAFVGFLNLAALYPMEKTVFLYDSAAGGRYSSATFVATFSTLAPVPERVYAPLFALVMNVATGMRTDARIFFAFATAAVWVQLLFGESIGIAFASFFDTAGPSVSLVSVVLYIAAQAGPAFSASVAPFLAVLAWAFPMK